MSNLPKFTPIFAPLNDVATSLVEELCDFIGFAGGSKTRSKHYVILASFLAAAQRMDQTNRMIWYTGKDSRSFQPFAYLPATGSTEVTNVRIALEEHGILENPRAITIQEAHPDVDPDFLEFYMEVSGFNNRPSPHEVPATMFQVDLSAWNALGRVRDATFIEAHLPPVLVNKQEEHEQKRQRTKVFQSAPKHSPTEARIAFGKPHTDALRASAQLHEMWLQHPLEKRSGNNHPSEFYASAKRIFHNGSIKQGGRYYGAWTQMSGSERLKLLIDGEAVAQVDLNAANVTLLSALLRESMDLGQTWADAYAAVVDRLDIQGQPQETIRDKVKQVISELCGSGNPNKQKPALNSDSPFCVTNETGRTSFIANAYSEFAVIRDASFRVFPALNRLSSYYSSAGYLSYHESQLITEVMLTLWQQGIVGYPVHDCILLKQSVWREAIPILRQVCDTYFRKHGKGKPSEGYSISPALTVESMDIGKLRLEGYYH